MLVNETKKSHNHPLKMIECYHQPIWEIDYRGNILFRNLAARVLLPSINQLSDQHPLLDGVLEKINTAEVSDSTTIVYNAEITLFNVIYDAHIIAHPIHKNILIFLNDITLTKKVEQEINILNKELEQRVIARTHELMLAKEHAEYLSHKAEEANRLKSEFLANMSHELRTPLNAIIGFSQLIYNGKIGPVQPEQKNFLLEILLSSKHLLQLINDILDLSKIEAGYIELNPESIELPAVVTNVLSILHPLILEKSIEIIQSIDPNLIDIIVDKSKLKQILFNYLSNAIKFSQSKSKIEIVIVGEGKDEFRLSVKDEGIGIREEHKSKLFIEFQQLDSGTAKKYSGTGLGLALTRRFAEAQGGRVGVLSDFGKGSTFYVILPRRIIRRKSKS